MVFHAEQEKTMLLDIQQHNKMLNARCDILTTSLVTLHSEMLIQDLTQCFFSVLGGLKLLERCFTHSRGKQ